MKGRGDFARRIEGERVDRIGHERTTNHRRGPAAGPNERPRVRCIGELGRLCSGPVVQIALPRAISTLVVPFEPTLYLFGRRTSRLPTEMHVEEQLG